MVQGTTTPGEHWECNPATYTVEWSPLVRDTHDRRSEGRYCVAMTWAVGRSTLEYLLQQQRLERLDPGGASETADAILDRANSRLATARAALEGGDVDGAFVNAYDTYRMCGESLLARQALRSTGGEGSHVTVEDAVSAQFSGEVPGFAKPTFERFRRQRHSAQYFEPGQPDVTEADAVWAIDLAAAVVEGTRSISGGVGRFE